MSKTDREGILQISEQEATDFLATSGVSRDDLLVVFKEIRAKVDENDSNELLVQAIISAYQFDAPALTENGETIATMFMTWYTEKENQATVEQEAV